MARTAVKGGGVVSTQWEHTCSSAEITVTDAWAFIEKFIQRDSRDLHKYQSAIYQALFERLCSFFPTAAVKLPSRRMCYARIRYIRRVGIWRGLVCVCFTFVHFQPVTIIEIRINSLASCNFDRHWISLPSVSSKISKSCLGLF